MKDGELIRPAGRISTIAETNEANANRVPIDYGYHGDEPKRTWDGDDYVPSEPETLEPVAAFVAVANGLDVDVDASASFDTDSIPEDAPLDYLWDFGDESASETGVTASHTYDDDGTYTITLVVTDASGAEAEITQDITVAAIV